MTGAGTVLERAERSMDGHVMVVKEAKPRKGNGRLAPNSMWKSPAPASLPVPAAPSA